MALLSTFRTHAGELSKQSAEARDNVKFLTTLERHFKAITHGPLDGVLLHTICWRGLEEGGVPVVEGLVVFCGGNS